MTNEADVDFHEISKLRRELVGYIQENSIELTLEDEIENLINVGEYGEALEWIASGLANAAGDMYIRGRIKYLAASMGMNFVVEGAKIKVSLH